MFRFLPFIFFILSITSFTAKNQNKKLSYKSKLATKTKAINENFNSKKLEEGNKKNYKSVKEKRGDKWLNIFQQSLVSVFDTPLKIDDKIVGVNNTNNAQNTTDINLSNYENSNNLSAINASQNNIANIIQNIQSQPDNNTGNGSGGSSTIND